MSYTYDTSHTSAQSNWMKGRDGHKVEGITIHHWGSSKTLDFYGIVNFLCSARPSNPTSAHYIVQGRTQNNTPDRRVACIVDPDDTAYHAGNWQANLTEIGIECRPYPTDADYDVIAELVMKLRSTYGDVPLYPHKHWTATECPGEIDVAKIDALARQKANPTQGRCVTTMYRNILVCAHSVPKYEAYAKDIGQAIYAKPIRGSYTDAAGSGGTHRGGGACDFELDGYTPDQGTFCETTSRKVLLLGWKRWWDGNHHLHTLDPECPNLSPEAKDQFEDFRKGRNGLSGTSEGPDTGSRSNAAAILAAFDRTQEETMLTLSDIIKGVWEGVKWLTPEGVEATPASFLRAANNKAGRAAQDAAAALAVVRAQAKQAAPLTADQVEAIVKQAIADSVTVTGTLTATPKTGA